MSKQTKWFMAIDQYGQHYDGLRHPRKDLMQRLYCKHCQKQYTEMKDGSSCHSGYVIGRLWLTVYEVIPMRKAA